MRKCCKDCKFSNSSEVDMYCHYYPPKVFMMVRNGDPMFFTKSPLVHPNHWCSKFELFYGPDTEE